MSAEITVLIPTLDAESVLADTLCSLLEGVTAGLIRELVVSDGGSRDATLAIADAAGAVIVTGPPSRGGQLRRGAARARGSWILVLHADTALSPGWSRAVADHLATRGEPAHFRLRFRASGLSPALVAGWANLRSFLFGLPYGDQGLLIRRAEYERAGGFPDQPLMEDVALMRALGRRPVALPVVAETGAERYRRDGWVRRGARNLWTLARYFGGVDPAKLARDYSR